MKYVSTVQVHRENVEKVEELVLAGALVEKEFVTETMAVQETDIAGAECSTMTEDGILFSPYGIIMPKLYNSDCGIFLFRYLISQSTDTEWKNCRSEDRSS